MSRPADDRVGTRTWFRLEGPVSAESLADMAAELKMGDFAGVGAP